MNEQIEPSHKVIKRTLTITTVETWTITIRWSGAEAPGEDIRMAEECTEQLRSISIGHEEAK